MAPPASVDPQVVHRGSVDPGVALGARKVTLFASVWLIYLVSPLGSALHSAGGWRTVGVLALLTFAVAFVLGCLWLRRPRQDRHARVLLLLGAMAGLLAVAAPAAGEAVTGAMIYLGVLAVMSLPPRGAAAAVGVLAVSAEVIPRLVPGWAADNFFAFQVVVACFAAWGVMGLVTRNFALVQVREELARLAVADERARLSRDLHDILGHSLTVITVKAELAGRLAHSESAPQTAYEIADVERLARDALAELRATIAGRRSLSLGAELAAARNALQAAGIRADLPTAADGVPTRCRDLFAWAVREGVTNVVRHSGAEQCSVRLSAHTVRVLDDGAGAGEAPGQIGLGGSGHGVTGHGATGHGLTGLRERARELGGRLDAGPLPGGGGFELLVEVPGGAG